MGAKIGFMTQEEALSEIRNQLRDTKVWEKVEQLKIYTVEDFINEFTNYLPVKLQELMKTYVNRLQKYFDERIIEPK